MSDTYDEISSDAEVIEIGSDGESEERYEMPDDYDSEDLLSEEEEEEEDGDRETLAQKGTLTCTVPTRAGLAHPSRDKRKRPTVTLTPVEEVPWDRLCVQWAIAYHYKIHAEFDNAHYDPRCPICKEGKKKYS